MSQKRCDTCEYAKELPVTKREIIDKLDSHLNEVNDKIEKIDRKRGVELKELESKINEELRRGSERFLSIASDLGEIKGALNVKKEVAGDLKEFSQNNKEEMAAIRKSSQKVNDKVMWLAIGMLSSGLIAAILHIVFNAPK